MYRIDWSRLVRDVVPAVLRRERLLAFLDALVSPVTDLHQRFRRVRYYIFEELPIGPEVCVLRYYLNQRFDYFARRIRILDGQAVDALRLYTEAEDQTIYLPIHLSARRVDFTVELPDELRGFETRVRALLDRHKLPTKTYRIIYT